jgi:adenosylcobyric acid synthase
MSGAILVCGTHSDAGKSAVVTGMCRLLAREGVSVAPFKGQNMALNSFVTREGAEIGRSQASQAAAARAEPEAAMNPVLLKPSGEGGTQVIVRGKPYTTATAKSYQGMKRELMPVVLDSLEDLRRRFEVVICEGAGSPAEINLRSADITNMGLAREAGLPVVLVGDIDRGGVFASLYGTLALLSGTDQSLVGGFLINRFRGDPSVLASGLEKITELTGRPVLGTLPHKPGLPQVDGEDSLALDSPPAVKPALGRDHLSVAVARLGRISNFTDYDALAHEPGVSVRFTDSPEALLRADLAILPGTKATVEDLALLRHGGMDRALEERAARGLPVLGVCGGYQMLGHSIRDGVESLGDTEVRALGLLPVETVFEEEKLLTRPEGRAVCFGGELAEPVSAYEIRHGRVSVAGGEPLFETGGGVEGCRVGNTLGTSWHGVLECDGFRRALLGWVAAGRRPDWRPGDEPFAAARERRFDILADLISENVDRDALMRLIEEGPTPGLPLISSRLSEAGVQAEARAGAG